VIPEGVSVREHHIGGRRQDSEKFAKDAAVLETASLKEPDNARYVLKEPDNARYVFCLAQSYRDAGQYEKAQARLDRITTYNSS
jgi:hypothetical protein